MPKFLRHLDLHLIVVTSKKAAAAEFEHDTNAKVGGEENFTIILFLGKTSAKITARRYDIQ